MGRAKGVVDGPRRIRSHARWVLSDSRGKGGEITTIITCHPHQRNHKAEQLWDQIWKVFIIRESKISISEFSGKKINFILRTRSIKPTISGKPNLQAA